VSFAFMVSDVVPASPHAVYDAWLSSKGHADITGGQPAQISSAVGDGFVVWNNYITGKNLELEPGRRIVQSWRTTKFTDADEGSRIEVTFVPEGAGTRVTVKHTNVPDGHTSYRDGGWQQSYFDPMKQYFARLGSHSKQR
jgi:uncharacterized protein YndB with AHSA1/START domain